MSTIYVPSTAPSTSSIDTRVSSVAYPSPFPHAPPRRFPRRSQFEYDDCLDPMFDSKYRRNYDRVHRGQHALSLYNASYAHGGAAASYGLQPTGAYYPYTGAYPYSGYGAGYGQMYPSMGMGGMGMGMGMGAAYDPMLSGYDSDYGHRGYGRRFQSPWGRRRMMLDRNYDSDDDFYY